MKKIVRLTESDLARIVKRVIKEQAPTDVYNQSSMGRVSNEPSMGRAKSNEFDWKSHFDQIKNELDSYLNTIEGPVDVKRFQSKVMNTYYQMVSNVDDEYSYPSHGRDFQQLTTDFMSYFTNKLKELIQNYGKLTESDLLRIVKKILSEQDVRTIVETTNWHAQELDLVLIPLGFKKSRDEKFKTTYWEMGKGDDRNFVNVSFDQSEFPKITVSMNAVKDGKKIHGETKIAKDLGVRTIEAFAKKFMNIVFPPIIKEDISKGIRR